MNELQRQHYLSALGVESYAPRWLLPGAPEPRLCTRLPVAIPVAEPEIAAQAPQAVATPVRAEGPQALSDVMRQMTGSGGGAAPLSTALEAAPALPTTPTAQPTVAPFTLSIWRSSLPILVLDSREPRAAMPTERLVRNLLRSLGDVDPASVTEEVLACPLVPKPTPADVREELSTWLEAELGRRPVQTLLLMGHNATHYLVPEDAEKEQLLWQWVPLPGLDRPALIAPSLVDLLREPSHKRTLWRALHPADEA